MHAHPRVDWPFEPLRIGASGSTLAVDRLKRCERASGHIGPVHARAAGVQVALWQATQILDRRSPTFGHLTEIKAYHVERHQTANTQFVDRAMGGHYDDVCPEGVESTRVL